jgi:hypothetical protein
LQQPDGFFQERNPSSRPGQPIDDVVTMTPNIDNALAVRIVNETKTERLVHSHDVSFRVGLAMAEFPQETYKVLEAIHAFTRPPTCQVFSSMARVNVKQASLLRRSENLETLHGAFDPACAQRRHVSRTHRPLVQPLRERDHPLKGLEHL